MSSPIRRRGATVATLAVLIGVALVAAAPKLGIGRANATKLWTDEPPKVSGQTVTAPDWVTLAKALKPAVVNVSTKRVESGPSLPPGMSPNDPFSQFFRQFEQRPHAVRSLGSGFIINGDGYVVSNNHVVDGASEIRVKLSDGREFPGKVVGRDSKTDLALLKIEATGLPTIPMGDSEALQVGEPVMAIGNPFGLEQTVTTGIVSGTGRVIGGGPYDDFIQTDASINPGNSGGPLINARGQAIGINAAIFSQSGGSIGIGFAIPVNLAKPVLTQLAEGGHVVRGWLGVSIQPVTPALAKGLKLSESTGALVSSVTEGSPAAKAGLKPGDVILEFNGQRVARADRLPNAVATTPVGREVPMAVMRDGKPMTLTVKVGKQAESADDQAESKKVPAALGLTVEPVTPRLAHEMGLRDEHGVVVRDVEADSPAADAGLREGDVIVEVNHHAVRSATDMHRQIDELAKGTPVLMLVHRGDSSLFIAVTA
ncbi:MAG TPA: DegQ family serine endoprotease [Methylomirabilota bacterium]|jgi:serine protease Do